MSSIVKRRSGKIRSPGTGRGSRIQKILDHRGVVLDSLIGALAYVELARAYALQGDIPRARTAYEDFFNLWRDADKDVPVLIAAKSEYAKLE
jgi:hypothetical protein